MKDINDDSVENDFEFENYIPIALSDWNMARLGLISKVVTSQARIVIKWCFT